MFLNFHGGRLQNCGLLFARLLIRFVFTLVCVQRSVA
jgi:hypothetical protein